MKKLGALQWKKINKSRLRVCKWIFPRRYLKAELFRWKTNKMKKILNIARSSRDSSICREEASGRYLWKCCSIFFCFTTQDRQAGGSAFFKHFGNESSDRDDSFLSWMVPLPSRCTGRQDHWWRYQKTSNPNLSYLLKSNVHFLLFFTYTVFILEPPTFSISETNEDI